MFANIIGNIMLYVQMSVWLMCMFLWFKSAADFWNFIVLWLNVRLLTLLLYGFLISLVHCGPTLFLEINKHVNKKNGFMPLYKKMLYLKYTLSVVYFMVSQGSDEAQAPAALVMRYLITYKFISKWFQKKTFHPLSQTPHRTSLAEEWGEIQTETHSWRGVKERNPTFLSTQGFWFEVSGCQRCHRV